MNSSLSTSPALGAGLPSRAARPSAAPFLPHARISPRTALWSFMLGLGLVAPMAIAIGLLNLPSATAGKISPTFTQLVFQPGALFLKAVLLMPLLEEIFFRGLLLPLFRRKGPMWSAVTVSAIFFGFWHISFGLGNVLNATLLGGVFAGLVLRTGSLLPAILCHSAFNFGWLFLCVPAFGILEKIMADPVAAQAMNLLTGLFPWWWIAISVALVATAVPMIRCSTQREKTSL